MYSAPPSDDFNGMSEPCYAAIQTHCEGMLFFILNKYKSDRAKLFHKTKEQLDLMRDHNVDPSKTLPAPLVSQVTKAMSLKK